MEEELLLAFDSTQQALRAEMLLEYAEIEIDIFPTPKEITAGCAMSIQFYRNALEEVRVIVAEQQVEIRGIFARSADGAGYVEVTEKGKFDENDE
ncbi:DUF3343 domain-containing protein [Paenibacillus sp. MMS20-IR301]|uniref:DUF3343 domain-containing protein n=1 Tax=Paenibacillus sp. MMS20-IR301 TaxID=2895946 RepID=UPI0028E4C71E|nr:DUF3343 domain-containing protein [Paenibacillus sp. MMS20-IR301]WNS42243.1 DUF3343 domain-containing protein [Paenibacillus sp. MMS20-IR301]